MDPFDHLLPGFIIKNRAFLSIDGMLKESAAGTRSHAGDLAPVLVLSTVTLQAHQAVPASGGRYRKQVRR